MTTAELSAAQHPAGAVQHTRPHIVIVGGGFVGYGVARKLQRKLRIGEAEVTLIDASGIMTYQPFLAEAAGGHIEPRHLTVPLQQVLKQTTVVTGRVTGVDPQRRCVTVCLPDGTSHEETYDHLVLAPGAVPRTRPIPGIAEHATGFGTAADAVYLRDRVLEKIALAAATDDQRTFQRALTFVVIGGGYTGVEAVGELQNLAVAAIKRYPNLKPRMMRWELVEASDEVMPEVPPKLGDYTRRRLEKSGIAVRLRTQVTSLIGGVVELNHRERFEADTVVWTAGVRAHPLMATLGVPVDARGRLQCEPTLAVAGLPGVWAAGDAAAVPDLAVDRSDARCGPTAQHAMRQAKTLAGNILAQLRSRPKLTRDYRHPNAGSVASLGLHRGVAWIYHVPVRGPLAWLLHRCYHLMMMPTWGRKVRIAAGWFAALLGGRDLSRLPQPLPAPPLHEALPADRQVA